MVFCNNSKAQLSQSICLTLTVCLPFIPQSILVSYASLFTHEVARKCKETHTPFMSLSWGGSQVAWLSPAEVHSETPAEGYKQMLSVTKFSKIALLPKTLMTRWGGTGAAVPHVDHAQLRPSRPGSVPWSGLSRGSLLFSQAANAPWGLWACTSHLGESRSRGPSASAGKNFHCLRCVALDSAKNPRPFTKNTKGIYLKNARQAKVGAGNPQRSWQKR